MPVHYIHMYPIRSGIGNLPDVSGQITEIGG
jgi:hypothetical protein